GVSRGRGRGLPGRARRRGGGGRDTGRQVDRGGHGGGGAQGRHRGHRGRAHRGRQGAPRVVQGAQARGLRGRAPPQPVRETAQAGTPRKLTDAAGYRVQGGLCADEPVGAIPDRRSCQSWTSHISTISGSTPASSAQRTTTSRYASYRRGVILDRESISVHPAWTSEAMPAGSTGTWSCCDHAIPTEDR